MEKRIIFLTCCLFFYSNFYSQLTANFSASATNICVGQSISFTNLSTPDAVLWDWTFQTATGTTQNFSGAVPPPITYNTTGSYYVILVIEDISGNQDSEFKAIYINVVGPPIITLTSAPNSNNQIICEGNSLQPIITYSVNYANSATVTGLPTGVGFSVSTAPTGCLVTITGTPTTAGVYPFTVESLQNFCGNTVISSSGTITVNSLPIVNAGNDQSICIGSPVTLTATGANAFSWNNGVVNGVAFTPSSTAMYTVTGSNATSGCQNTDQVLVTVNNLPIVDAGPNQSICSGTAITLAATGADTYSWDNGVINGIAFTPASTTTYTVTGTNTLTGCTNTDQVSITVNILPQAGAGGSETICVNSSSTVFGATASGGNISWTHNGNGTLTNETTLTPTYNSVNSDAGNTVTLTLTVNNVNSCGNPNAFATFTVVVNGNPTLSLISPIATTNQLVCNNASITNIQYVFGVAGTNVSVSGLPDGVVPNISGNSLTISGSPAQIGSFNYMVTTTSACPSIMLMGTIESQSATLELLSAPYTNDQLICLGNAIEPIVYGIGAPVTLNDLPAGLIGTFSPGIPNTYTISGTPLNFGSFHYTVNINGQCGNDFLIGNIIIQSIISGNTSGLDTTVCDGSAFELIGGPINTNVSTVYSYMWQFSSNINGPYIPAPGINTTANYTATMNAFDTFNYFRRVVVAGACSDTAMPVFVSADSIPEILAIGSASICSNDTVNVSTISILNGSISSWISSGNGQLITTDMNNPIYIADSSDAGSTVNLTFVLASNNVCSPDSLVGVYPITVRPNPIAFLGGSAHICAVDMDAVVTGAIVQNGNFQWSDNGFGNLSNTNSLSPVYTSVIEDTGSVVSIFLEVSSGSDCTYPLIDTAIFTVIVDSVGINPGINSFAGVDTTIELGQSIALYAQGVAITNWMWSPSLGLSENGIFNPIASPTLTTQYILTVYNILGCVDIDTLLITVIPDVNFNIPSLFTPNGDGLNETWDIPELLLIPNTSVTIINREGQEVFSSDNYINNWDGTYKGNPLPEATYYYWIKFANSDSVFKGPVTILRNKK